MDLSGFKLTLPIDANADLFGAAREIQGQDIALGADYYWFEHKESGLIFRCPDHGATTPGTSSPRSELRHLTNFAVNQSSSMNLVTKVNKADPAKNITIAQIHAGSSPMCKIVYKNGLVRAFIKPLDASVDDIKLTLGNVPLGQNISLLLGYDANGLLTVTMNGATITQQTSRTGTYFYKHGAYPTDNLNDDAFVYEVATQNLSVA